MLGRAVLSLIGLFALACLAWVAYREPVTTATFDLHTEHASFKVTNGDAARFVLANVRVRGSHRCFKDLIVTPISGQRITYVREGRGALFVSLPGGTIWEHSIGHDRERLRQTEPVELEVAPAVCDARTNTGVRLPINGIATFGQSQRHVAEPGDRTAAILSGQIVVYARALPDLFWAIPLSFGPFERSALFVVGEMDVPGGAILATGDAGMYANRADGVDPPHWSGFVDVEFGDDDARAMTVKASVNTADVRIHMQSARVVADEDRFAAADVIPLKLLARLTGDPNLQLIYLVLGALAAVIKMLASVSEWFFRRGSARDKHDSNLASR